MAASREAKEAQAAAAQALRGACEVKSAQQVGPPVGCSMGSAVAEAMSFVGFCTAAVFAFGTWLHLARIAPDHFAKMPLVHGRKRSWNTA